MVGAVARRQLLAQRLQPRERREPELTPGARPLRHRRLEVERHDPQQPRRVYS